MLRRVGPYMNANTKLEWKCLTCNHHWFAVPSTVIRGVSGCPSCNGGIKLTEVQIDQKLEGRQLHRKELYRGMTDPLIWECELCKHTWSATPNNVINHNSGCPVCALVQAGKSKSLTSKPRVIETLQQKNLSSPTFQILLEDKQNVLLILPKTK